MLTSSFPAWSLCTALTGLNYEGRMDRWAETTSFRTRSFKMCIILDAVNQPCHLPSPKTQAGSDCHVQRRMTSLTPPACQEPGWVRISQTAKSKSRTSSAACWRFFCCISNDVLGIIQEAPVQIPWKQTETRDTISQLNVKLLHTQVWVKDSFP